MDISHLSIPERAPHIKGVLPPREDNNFQPMGHVEVPCTLCLRKLKDFCSVLRRNNHWNVDGGVQASVRSWPK